MRDRTDTGSPGRRIDVVALAPYVLTIGAVLLAWQIVIQPLAERAPVEIAVRLAPGSPRVLTRAAEAELKADRVDNAAALARDALSRSPFDVRALRTVGLTVAREGRIDQADEMLTLAGNWSLRDDPSHAWLVEHRLRRGDYASALAHADTLVRRREDIYPAVFRLFTMAAATDAQRALPVVAQLLAADPPWRQAYLTSLYDSPDGLGVAGSLAVMLQAGSAPLTNTELEQLYVAFMGHGQIDAIKTIRARLNRPRSGPAVVNGGFDDPAAPQPFQWTLVQKAGAAAAFMDDDVRGGPALRAEYDGYATALIVRQQMFLSPGRYRFRAESRTEAGDPDGHMAWSLTCGTGGQRMFTAPATPAGGSRQADWTPAAVEFSIPAACPVQTLDLQGLPGDSRSPMAVWFDSVSITATNRAQG